MQSKRAWLVYLTVRLLAFAVPFAILMIVLRGWLYDWVAAGLTGAVVSLLVSYIFLRPQRIRMGEDLWALRHRTDRRGDMEIEEDAELERTGDEAGEDEDPGDVPGRDTKPTGGTGARTGAETTKPEGTDTASSAGAGR